MHHLIKKTFKYSLELFLVFNFSCQKVSEDIHPEMPFFHELNNKEFVIKNIESQPLFIDCFKAYYFFFNNTTNTFFIYQKVDGFKLVKTLNNAKSHYISSEGTVYYAHKDEEKNSVKGYKVEYPYITVTSIETLELENYLSEEKIIESNKDEYERLSLYSKKLDSLIKDKRAKFIKENFSNKLKCIRKISAYNSFHIFEYYNGKEQIVKNLSYTTNNKTLLKAATSINFYGSNESFPYCNESHKIIKTIKVKNEENKCIPFIYNQDFRLELTDSVTLKYSIEGSNHIAIGVSSKKLYYYKFYYKNKTLEFKSIVPLKLGSSPNYKHLVFANEFTYSIK